LTRLTQPLVSNADIVGVGDAGPDDEEIPGANTIAATTRADAIQNARWYPLVNAAAVPFPALMRWSLRVVDRVASTARPSTPSHTTGGPSAGTWSVKAAGGWLPPLLRASGELRLFKPGSFGDPTLVSAGLPTPRLASRLLRLELDGKVARRSL